MSERNRELLNLFVVGMLTALGFASVYIARQSEVSTGSLSYAAFFFGLYLVAHFVARYAVPNADPYLLPMAALLTAVGVTEIYRLNPDGIPGDNGIQFDGPGSLDETRKLAKALRAN